MNHQNRPPRQFILNGQLDVGPLISTRDFLTKVLQTAKSELEIAGAVQAFEVCYELAWKTCKKVLSLRGVEVFTPKEVFRIAGLKKHASNFSSRYPVWFNSSFLFLILEIVYILV